MTVTPCGYEYRDLADTGVLLLTDLTAALAAAPGLLIVDAAEHLIGDAAGQALRSAHDAVLLTALDQSAAALRCATPPAGAASPLTASYAVRHQPRGAAAGQNCLDWPPATVPVLLDRRHPRDFPIHKWAIDRR